MWLNIWVLRLFTLTIFIMGLANYSSTNAQAPPVGITFPGKHGIGDPSLAESPAGSTRVWMTYSAVDPSPTWPQNMFSESVRFAFSDDQGVTWTDAGPPISTFTDVTLPLPAPLNAGTWVSEVSQIAYDPNALPGQTYKVLWHHYLVINGGRAFEHSWIALKTADSPQSLAAASEIKLFVGAGYDTHNNDSVAATSPPVIGPPSISLDAIFPQLRNCHTFTEPGLYASTQALYLVIYCGRPSDNEELISLLKCQSPCDMTTPSSWSYVKTLFNKAQARAHGSEGGYAAPSLFRGQNGDIYLSVTPTKVSPSTGGYYKGCDIYKFVNINTGLLQSRPMMSITDSAGKFIGACTYNYAARQTGLIKMMAGFNSDDVFQLISTGINF